MIELESRPKHREQVLSQQASNTLVLFNLDDGQYYALDEVGSRVWELCDGTRSIAEIISVICQEYDAPRETIEADVLGLLRDLADEKLVADGY